MKNVSKQVVGTAAVLFAGAGLASISAHALVTSSAESALERTNSQLSTQIATSGMVLLQNKQQALPVATNQSIALFGSGAYGTYKGGSGSGDVNPRQVINIWTGLQNAGYQISSDSWLQKMATDYDKQKALYAATLAKIPFAGAYQYKDPQLTDADFDAAKATTGVYVISRSSGEGNDRKDAAGDYQLTNAEKANIKLMAKHYDKSVVLLNVGGPVDTSFIQDTPKLDSVLLVSQGGQNTGTAVADILSGKVTPSGKLTATWAKRYADYPSAGNFSNNDSNTGTERYNEGIYMGYRYFDSYNKTPEFAFGYGGSYTSFKLTPQKATVKNGQYTAKVKVQNTGKQYSGSDVVQLYYSAPKGDVPKAFQNLGAYAKTGVLAPGASQTVTLGMRVSDMASYETKHNAFEMTSGKYLMRIGDSSRRTQVATVLNLPQKVQTQKVESAAAPAEDPTLLTGNRKAYEPAGQATQVKQAQQIALKPSTLKVKATPVQSETESTTPSNIANPTLKDVYDGKLSMAQFVGGLTSEQLSNIVEGNVNPLTEAGRQGIWNQIGGAGGVIGGAATSLPGAAGQTTADYEDSLGIPVTINSDGPAGLRLPTSYVKNGQTYYNYATAWPIGTLVAQTWDPSLIEKMGQATAKEMKAMGITTWLAPGMNLQRNPLGGRNFEYYSEDPLVSGVSATAETRGVQATPGLGVAIKHFAVNSQEDSRMTSNSVVSEQALRELYLRGFEIAVKDSQPQYVMSSYNKLNGTYTAENKDLLTTILRNQWGYKGAVMTDWFSFPGLFSAAKVMAAGNDLIMPGGSQVFLAHDADKATRQAMEKSASRVLNMVMNSDQFADKYHVTVPSVTPSNVQSTVSINGTTY